MNLDLDGKETQMFVYGMVKNPPFDFTKLFDYFHKTVMETNTLVGLKPFDDEGNPTGENEKIRQMYVKLRIEEGAEIFSALENKDRVEFLDGIVDLLVIVGYEYYATTGILIEFDPSETTVMDNVAYLKDQYETSFETINEHRLYHILQAAHGILVELNVDHFEALMTVLNSNLSKFPTEEELMESRYEGDLQKSIIAEVEDIESLGRYGGVTGKLIVDSEGDNRIVFWSATEYGKEKVKYLKPFSFVEPDFVSCWRCEEFVFDNCEGEV